jgi:ABC-type transporter Mla subunit MlaD
MSSTDGVDDIKAGIERTRDQLGATVQALAEKADLKGRAQEKVSGVSERLSASLADGKEQAASLASDAAAALSKTTESLPEPAKDALRRGSELAGRYRAQIVAAVAAVVGLLIIRKRRH